ncbi:MAG: flagellar biosynthesis protein FlhA [Oligoflexales bacterium]
MANHEEKNPLKNTDIQFALVLICILLVMFIPLPPFLLDLFLTISITVGFMSLLVAIYIEEPLDFSTFPTFLLLTTLFRLSLNVATTRNILLGGANNEVSQIVTAFGDFVVGGNYFVGFVIFAILVLVNFLVITKGAGRVAEVGARFTLDAMPGKQMSIDADLNAGIIDREEAKKRRSKIEQEADFYGSMDGASKFVRGDAIAGIIITAINIIVGLIIGVVHHNMSFSDAAQRFTLLTVGDGLVSQIPSIIISVAAGIVVTRAASTEALSGQLSGQIFLKSKPAYMSSGILIVLGIIPGMPGVPFLLLGTAFFFLGRHAQSLEQKTIEEMHQKDHEEEENNKAPANQIESLLQLDTLALEVGVGLIPLVDSEQDGEVLDRIVSARKQFAQDLGIIVPMVMVRDNIQLKPGDYQILLRGNVITRGNLMVDHLLAMSPDDQKDRIQGIRAKEPAYGLDALWIRQNQQDEASFHGYTVVNCSTVIVTHLTKVIHDHAHELLGRQEVQSLIENLKQSSPKVVEEVLSPESQLNLGVIVKVLQNLLREGVSIRDSLTIFEAIANECRITQHPDILTCNVRIALGRGIIKKYLKPDDTLSVAHLDRAVEDLLLSSMNGHENGATSLNLDPELAQRLLNSIAASMKDFDHSGSTPILLCGSPIRKEIKKMLDRFIPGVPVLAFDEIPSEITTQTITTVSLS